MDLLGSGMLVAEMLGISRRIELRGLGAANAGAADEGESDERVATTSAITGPQVSGARHPCILWVIYEKEPPFRKWVFSGLRAQLRPEGRSTVCRPVRLKPCS